MPDVGRVLISGNVAYRKYADQGWNDYSEVYKAGNAVDGDTDPKIRHQHCSLAQQYGLIKFSWLVDLGELYDIEEVTLIGTLGE